MADQVLVQEDVDVQGFPFNLAEMLLGLFVAGLGLVQLVTFAIPVVRFLGAVFFLLGVLVFAF